VYVTEDVVIALSVPCAGAVHVTPAFAVSFATVAVMCTTVPWPIINGLSDASVTALKLAGFVEQPAFQSETIAITI
jgi:hypothetical protein